MEEIQATELRPYEKLETLTSHFGVSSEQILKLAKEGKVKSYTMLDAGDFFCVKDLNIALGMEVEETAEEEPVLSSMSEAEFNLRIQKARSCTLPDRESGSSMGDIFSTLYDETIRNDEINGHDEGKRPITELTDSERSELQHSITDSEYKELAIRTSRLASSLHYWLAVDNGDGKPSVASDVVEYALYKSNTYQHLAPNLRTVFKSYLLDFLKRNEGKKCYCLKAYERKQLNPEQEKPRLSSAVLKPYFTIEALSDELNERGIVLKWDVVRNREITDIVDTDELTVQLHSQLRDKYKGVTLQILQAYRRNVAKLNKVNPPLEEIVNTEWDGHNRIPEIEDFYGFANDPLSCSLFEKWLYQAIWLLQNDDGKLQPDGALVLQGGQGQGKTTLMKYLAFDNPLFYSDGGKLDFSNKDCQIESTSVWMYELAEIEQTMRGDKEALKGFLTKAKDTYRVPYAPESEEHPRRTSFFGTCNSSHFLVDTTGNRRFWTIPIETKCRGTELWETLHSIDVHQLWKEAYIFATVTGNTCFRLDGDEIDELSARNREHEALLPGEQELQDVIARYVELKEQGTNIILKDTQLTTWKQLHPSLAKYSSIAIAKALQHMGQTPKRSHGATLYSLPVVVATYKDE